jgi:hypothetical protein
MKRAIRGSWLWASLVGSALAVAACGSTGGTGAATAASATSATNQTSSSGATSGAGGSKASTSGSSGAGGATSTSGTGGEGPCYQDGGAETFGCADCLLANCVEASQACSNDFACMQAVNALGPCACKAQDAKDSAGVQTCVDTFNASSSDAPSFSACVKSACFASCGF